MSDQENPDGSPRPKRSRISRPFQVLSLPSIANANTSRQNNSRRRPAASQPMIVEDDAVPRKENSIAGVIKKLQLTNFMCHGNFEIEFNPRINFISGANGSGKSAIQTAIAIGLGGQASKTNRSSKIEGLIKHGCHSGNIMITLSNTGSNAYKPQEYGNQIRIVRNITPSSSTYKIYNQWDKVVSNKKGELDMITLKFKIQPNNPVSILNQDMARNFLSSNKAENKYIMFKKATLLDEAESMLNNINAQIAEQKERIVEKEKTEEIIDREINAMNEKMKLVEELKEAKQQREVLKDELMWSEVHKCREELNRLEEICEKHEAEKKESLDTVNEIKNEIIEKEKKIEELEQTLLALRTESRTKEETVAKYRQEFKVKKDRYYKKNEELHGLTRSIKNKNFDKEQIKASLDEVERTEKNHKSEKENAEKKIAQFQKSLQEYISKETVLKQEIGRLTKTTEELNDKKKHKERRIDQLNNEMRANERQMKALKTSDSLSVYSHWMPALVQRIKEAVKAGRFSKPPKGPLGQFIQVKQDQWTDAIEHHLGGGLLFSFLVNNSNDRKELYKIMDQVINGRKPTVHCSLFQEKNRNSALPQIEARLGSYLNIYRALKVSDPVVANFLMDIKHIHQVLLIEDTAFCRKTMCSRDWVKNCLTIINKDADSYNQGGKFYGNPNLKRARLLPKSVAQCIGSLTEEIETKKHAITLEESEVRSLKEQFIKTRSNINDLSSETQKYRSQISMAERSIAELKSVIETETPSLKTMFEEMTNLEKEIKELEENKQIVQEELKTLGEEMTHAKKFLDKCGIGDTALQQSHLSAEIENQKKAISAQKRRIENFDKKIEEQNMKLNSLKNRVEQQRAKTEEKCTQVSQYSQSQEPNEEERRSLQEVQTDLDKIMALIEEAEKKVGSESLTFEKDFISKQMSQRKFKKMFAELKKMHEKYRNMSSERKDVIRKLRDISTSVVYTQFEKVISSRNYKGQLLFDHSRGRLDIQLAPPDSGSNFMNSESLSGGEKSVSTVAFLMALWSNMDLPFYSMDEYDVFMDAINRRTITGLLTDFAKDKSSRQFIFLTPLDVSLIQTGPDVTVHKVKKIM